MIRLHKGPQPVVLRDNAAAWTADLLERLDRGDEIPPEVRRRYAHPTVKEQAIEDSYGKCIYCESRVRHISHGDLEHIRPKARFPDGTYDWTNLGLVCTKCNGSKGDKFDMLTPPINPFVDDPSAFLIAMGELIWPRPANDRGAVTEALVQLNRTELVEQRRRRLEAIRRAVELIHRATTHAAREVFSEQLAQELDSSSEYAFVARSAAAALHAG